MWIKFGTDFISVTFLEITANNRTECVDLKLCVHYVCCRRCSSFSTLDSSLLSQRVEPVRVKKKCTVFREAGGPPAFCINDHFPNWKFLEGNKVDVSDLR